MSAARMTSTGCVVTPRGIVIGGAYCAPPPPHSKDAEVIQAALLKGDRMALRIRTRPGLFLRIWRWLRGEA